MKTAIRVLFMSSVLMFISTNLIAQNTKACSGCSLTISTAWTSPIAASAGVTICVAPGGSISGDILIDGGTVCNEGSITSHNILMNSGSLINQNTLDVVNLAIYSGNFLNEDTAFIDSLSQTGAESTLTNAGFMDLLAHSVYHFSSVNNNGEYFSPNTSLAIGAKLFNYGNFVSTHLSLWDSDTTLFEVNLFNDGTGRVECDSMSVFEGRMENYGELLINYDFSSAGFSYLYNYEYMDIGRDFWLDTNAYLRTWCMIHVGGDWYNGGTIWGPPSGCGGFSVEGLSGNAGVFGGGGNLDMCDASTPGSFDLNTGTLDPGVTFCNCTNQCAYHSSVPENAGDHPFSALLSPNPLSGKAQLDLVADGPGSADLCILDLQGRTLMHENWEVHNGLNSREMDMTTLLPGLYLINIQTDNNSIRLKFIKE